MARRPAPPPAGEEQGDPAALPGAGAGVAEQPSQRAAGAQPIGRREGEVAGAAAVAMLAKSELSAITGLTIDHVSAVVRQEDGWHVIVDLVELHRIPSSTDVLAAYEAVLGPTGILLSYRRTRRYLRDQMLDLP